MVKQYLASIIILLLFITDLHAQNEVTNYSAYFAGINYKEQDIIVIRKFERKGQKYFLTVNCKTLITEIISSKEINEKIMSFEQINQIYKNAAYIKALDFSKTQSFTMQDAGIIHGYPKEKGITLTIDLCPSHRPLDRDIFSAVINEFSTIEKPVPVALSLSGRFMLTHS